MASKPFHESWNEKEPTCPGGGRMRWTVEVEEPDREIGSTCAMISVTEDSTSPKYGQDVLLLDVENTVKLIEVLTLALFAAREAEEGARASEKFMRDLEPLAIAGEVHDGNEIAEGAILIVDGKPRRASQ